MDLVLDRHQATLDEEATALFSPCRSYRYALTRMWDSTVSPAVFVMLNPSTADAFVEDPTVRRCYRFARDWGAGGLAVVNLFALRSTDPKALYRHPDPVGPDNDRVIAGYLAGPVGPVVCAWGVHGKFGERGAAVAATVRALGRTPLCLGVTAGGHPGHPLYVPAATALVEYQR